MCLSCVSPECWIIDLTDWIRLTDWNKRDCACRGMLVEKKVSLQHSEQNTDYIINSFGKYWIFHEFGLSNLCWNAGKLCNTDTYQVKWSKFIIKNNNDSFQKPNFKFRKDSWKVYEHGICYEGLLNFANDRLWHHIYYHGLSFHRFQQHLYNKLMYLIPHQHACAPGDWSCPFYHSRLQWKHTLSVLGCPFVQWPLFLE